MSIEDIFLLLGFGFALFAVLGLLGGVLEWWEQRYRTVGRHTRSLSWTAYGEPAEGKTTSEVCERCNEVFAKCKCPFDIGGSGV